MTTADLADGAELPVPPATAAEAEQLVLDLDRQRAEIAERFQAHNRFMPVGAHPAWSAIARELTQEGLALDRQRAAARRLAREMREREDRRAAWKAWHAVQPEHQELCARIVSALDALIPLVETEQALHRQLEQTAGRSMLHVLRADLQELHRLRRSAALVGRPNDGGAQ